MKKRGILEPGTKILNGRYEVLKVLHAKGMSNVYLILDSQLNKQWCLKEIRKSAAGKNNYEYYALLQEANIMKSLNHPKIPRITTIDEEGDSIFIVMDYIDGMSIKSYISKNGRISQDLVINWMMQITDILTYLHNRKKPIFYRDMKPDNVMVRSNGEIAIIDFGISVVIEEEGQLIKESLGTKGYAPPEQRKGRPCDKRSDIYALGRTMYCMLTGINPSLVEGDLRSIRELVPTISNGVERIVTKCMREDPDKRYQSCEELMYDLQNYGLYDDKYIKSVKFKVRMMWGMLAFGILTTALSFIPLQINKSNQEEKYNNLVTVAQQSGKAEDYEAVFSMKPESDIALYLDYIESLKVDGKFTKEEEEKLLDFVNPTIELLQADGDYGQFAYEMGKLYWFYYEGNADNEGMIASVRWFGESRDKEYEAELSDVYYQLGTFNRDILSSIAESEDVGMYSDYWGNLLKAKEVDTGELITLQINLCISNCISNYGYNLKNDGITKEEMLAQVNDLENFIRTYSPNSEVSQSKYDTLSTSLTGLSQRVESLYSEGGVVQ